MDTKEYERLVSLYLSSIYHVALNGCTCSSDAEDVVQNTFVKLWERKDVFSDDDYARKWLIRVAVNECKSLWRTAWHRKTTYLEAAEREPVFSTPGEERFILRSAGVACKVSADGTFVLFRRVQREGNRRTDEALGNSCSNKAPQSKAEAEGKVKGGMEMSGEEQNRGFYKETFEEVPVPEGLAEKVGSITEREEKRQRTVVGSVLRKVAIAAAILVALLVGSNGVAYAMTGKTWVKTMIVTFYIGDSVYDVEVEEQQLNNEESIYSGDFVTENGDKDHAEVYEQGQEVVFAYTNGAEVRSAYGKRTYILDEGIEIDITKDIEEDGKAVGTYEVNGILKGYSIVAIDEFGGLSVLVEILEEGMEGPDWPTKWAMKQIEDGTASYVPLLTPIPLPEPK